MVTDDQRRLERLKRSHYNASQVSDAALIESIVSTLEGSEPPDWVENEFQEPIPYGSDKDRISEAETWARETMNDTANPTFTEAGLAAQLNAVLGYIERSNLERSEDYISRLQRLMGEVSICQPFGP
jgi:hypothetical protein